MSKFILLFRWAASLACTIRLHPSTYRKILTYLFGLGSYNRAGPC